MLTTSVKTRHSQQGTWSGLLARGAGFLFGVLAYLVFLGAFLYAIGFVTGIGVPKTVDSGDADTSLRAVFVDLSLLAAFAIQHSGMARRGFKCALTRIVPASTERSVYVLAASTILIALFVFWEPLPEVIWDLDGSSLSTALRALGVAGWLIVLCSTFLISHFELFGLKQVTMRLFNQSVSVLPFRTPGLYRVVRHPIYFGFIVAFWATSIMTVGHLLFATVTTTYIFVGIALEERDLVAMFGDEYRRYRAKVAMIFPGLF